MSKKLLLISIGTVIFLSTIGVLVSNKKLSSAQLPNNSPEPTPAVEVLAATSTPKGKVASTPIPTKKPSPTPKAAVYTPTPTPLLVPEIVVSEGYTESEIYPIIKSFSDSLGSIIKRSSYNGYNGLHTSVLSGKTLKVGDEITWSVIASDPNNREIKYNFNSNSQRFIDVYGRGEYKSSNKFTYQITQDDLKSAGETLRIVVQIRSEKENYRFGSGQYDDSIFLDYSLIK